MLLSLEYDACLCYFSTFNLFHMGMKANTSAKAISHYEPCGSRLDRPIIILAAGVKTLWPITQQQQVIAITITKARFNLMEGYGKTNEGSYRYGNNRPRFKSKYTQVHEHAHQWGKCIDVQ